MSLRIAAHLCGCPKEFVDDRRRVMEVVQHAGYDGVEGFSVESPEELVELAALAAEYGLHLVNVGAPDPLSKAKINATLGNKAAEVPAVWKKAGQEPSEEEFGVIASSVASDAEVFQRYGIKAFHHIHVNTILETTEDCARVVERLPGLWLLYDTGHLLAANSDPMEVLRRWPHKIAHVHLKNFWTQDPQAGWNRRSPDFWQTSRFCDLAEGNVGFDVKAALDGLVEIGYGGWVALEEDHPRRNIEDVIRDNREYLRSLGY
ncbi:MAG: TIM barrel protein [Armatimonadetes bacterium]|nr:TIM barrel protein [Armatimonadota bacterium]